LKNDDSRTPENVFIEEKAALMGATCNNFLDQNQTTIQKTFNYS